MRSSTIERAATAILTVAIVVLGLAVGKRQFDGSVMPDPSPHPVFTPGWRALLARGITSGDTQAAIQLVEFADLQCTQCRRQHEELKTLRKAYGSSVALTYVHFPLPTHPFALPAAQAMECAGRAGALDQFVSAVFRNQDSLGLIPWHSYMRDAGIIDSVSFDRCFADKSVIGRVDSGHALGTRLGVLGTPVLLVNGWRYDGMTSATHLRHAVEALRVSNRPPGATELNEGQDAGVLQDLGTFHRKYDESAIKQSQRLVLSAVPIGTSDPASSAFDLTGVTSVVVLGDNRIVTLARQGPRLLLFDQHLRGVRLLGGHGQGPGEFRDPENIGRLAADSVVLLDPANDRVSWLLADRGVVRSRPIQRDVPDRTNMVAGGLPDGRLVLYSRPDMAPGLNERDSLRTAVSNIAVLPGRGRAIPVGKLHGPTFVTVRTNFRGRPGRTLQLVKFSHEPQIALWDSVVVITPTARYEIDLLALDGRKLGELHLYRKRIPVTASMKKLVINESLDRLNAPSPEGLLDRSESERLARDARFADSLPAIGALYPAGELLWVVDYVAPGSVGWAATAFRRDGSVAGQMKADLRGEPIAFGRDRVVVKTEGPDGAVTLRAYQIVPTGAAPKAVPKMPGMSHSMPPS